MILFWPVPLISATQVCYIALKPTLHLKLREFSQNKRLQKIPE